MQGDDATPDSARPEPGDGAGATAGAGAEGAATSGAEGTAGAKGVEGADLGRRRFFRQLTSDLIQTAATVAGAASVLQRTSAEAASAILDPSGTADRLGSSPGSPGVGPGIVGPGAGVVAPGATFRTAFRLGDRSIVLLDQRRLPGAITELECDTAAEVAHALRERVIADGPALAQAAALALALLAERMTDSSPFTRRAAFHGSANALVNARPTSFLLARAVVRMTAAFEAFGDLSDDGVGLAAVLRGEADAIVSEATAAHGRIAEHGLETLPDTGDRPTCVLTLGSSGVLAGGQFGTALGVISAANGAGRALRVLVAETRPLLQGVRLAAWELENMGIRAVVLADAACAGQLARGEIDVVLVAADEIAGNGGVLGVVGTYQLAVLAARHGVPFVVCAPTAAVNLDAIDEEALPVEERPATDVLWFGEQRLSPASSSALNPLADRTPPDLVSAIVTEAGILRPPFGPALAAAVAGTSASAVAATSPWAPQPSSASASASPDEDPA